MTLGQLARYKGSAFKGIKIKSKSNSNYFKQAKTKHQKGSSPGKDKRA
jgi:hypothetical protein